MIMPAARILEFSEVPVVDIGSLVRGAGSEARTVDTIARACQDVGFMYVRNHNVPASALNRLIEQARRFFALPTPDKMSVAVENSPHFRGYLPLEYTGNEGEKGKNLQEGFMIMHERPLDAFPMHGPNQWPRALPSLRSAMWDYFTAMENLAAPLLHGFALALGLKRDFFDGFHRRPMNVLKLNHYPPQEIMDETEIIGVGGHCDGGSFTILWQDSLGGLEVRNKRGDWVGVPPIEVGHSSSTSPICCSAAPMVGSRRRSTGSSIATGRTGTQSPFSCIRRTTRSFARWSIGRGATSRL